MRVRPANLGSQHGDTSHFQDRAAISAPYAGRSREKRSFRQPAAELGAALLSDALAALAVPATAIHVSIELKHLRYADAPSVMEAFAWPQIRSQLGSPISAFVSSRYQSV